MAFYNALHDRVSNTSENLKNAVRSIYEATALRYSRIFVSAAVFVALVGYGFFLLFPVLAISGISHAIEIISSDNIDWQSLSAWLFVLLLSIYVIYQGMQIRFSTTEGLNLVPGKAPELFKLIQKTTRHFKRPRIKGVVITSDYELDIHKLPRWPLPVWSDNILVVGLPVLLCHTPESFACLLSRKIGQFSKRNNIVTNWIYQLRSVWQQYLEDYKKQRRVAIEPARWFLYVYSPLYDVISSVPSRIDELKADSYAMELFNDEVVREMVSSDCVYEWYIKQQYWPAINKIAGIKTDMALKPMKQLEHAVRVHFSSDKINAALNNAMSRDLSWKAAKASLPDRLANIGHDVPAMMPHEVNNAATTFLGDSKQTVMDLIDNLWVSRNIERKKKKIRGNDKNGRDRRLLIEKHQDCSL